MKLVHRPSIFLYLPILFLAFVCIGNHYLFLVYFFFDPYIGIPSLLDGSAFEYLGFCSGNHKPIVDSTSDGILLLAAYPGIILFLLLLTLVISWVVFDYYTKRCRPVWISQDAIHLGLLRRPFMKKSEISSIGLAPEDPWFRATMTERMSSMWPAVNAERKTWSSTASTSCGGRASLKTV